jgi:hypothetical protein
MRYIAHRRNTIQELLDTPLEFGIEVDIRTQNNQLITQHDPFKDGEDFETWLSNYDHGTLILNIKEEGLEAKLLELMKKYKVEDFFFLDQSIPFMVKLIGQGENRTAVRFSEYESLETIINFEGKVKWIWVDCFTKFPLTAEIASIMKRKGFNICLVSPELHGRMSDEEISITANFINKTGLQVDAVCTKRISEWKKHLNHL